MTRTGRQPGVTQQTREQKKKREDRVSGRSIEDNGTSEASDSSSLIDPSSQMRVPEMDEDEHEPVFGGGRGMSKTERKPSQVPSPQTSYDIDENGLARSGRSTGKRGQLSVIISERESGLEDSVDIEATGTLVKGKETSNSRRRGKRELKDIKAKEKADEKANQNQGGCCSGGCSIF